jgi:hypothetical protein
MWSAEKRKEKLTGKHRQVEIMDIITKNFLRLNPTAFCLRAALEKIMFTLCVALANVGKYTVTSCNYDDNFSAIVQKDNFYGTQFHSEKSGSSGLKLFKEF